MRAFPDDRLLFWGKDWARFRHPDGSWGPSLALPGAMSDVRVHATAFLASFFGEVVDGKEQSLAVLYDLEGREQARWTVQGGIDGIAQVEGRHEVLTPRGLVTLVPQGQLAAPRPYGPYIPLPVRGHGGVFVFERQGARVVCLGNSPPAKDYSVSSSCQREGEGGYRFVAKFRFVKACGDFLVTLEQEPSALVVRELASGRETGRRPVASSSPVLECAGEQQLAVAGARLLELLDLRTLAPVARVPLPDRAVEDMAVLSKQVAYRLYGSPNDLRFAPRTAPER